MTLPFTTGQVVTAAEMNSLYYNLKSVLLTAVFVDLGAAQGTTGVSPGAILTSSNPSDNNIVLPFPGSIVGLSVRMSGARTAGTATVGFQINNAGGTTLVIDGTNTQNNYATYARTTHPFVAGDRVRATIASDASWAPTTSDAFITVFVSYDATS